MTKKKQYLLKTALLMRKHSICSGSSLQKRSRGYKATKTSALVPQKECSKQYNYKSSFKLASYRNSTNRVSYVWEVKEKNKSPIAKWDAFRKKNPCHLISGIKYVKYAKRKDYRLCYTLIALDTLISSTNSPGKNRFQFFIMIHT